MYDELKRRNVFKALGLFSDYLQIKMDDACRDMIKFATRSGTNHFEVMPFGLMKDAPETFQELMDELLRNLSFARAYLDDFVVFSKSFSDHRSKLKRVLGIVKEHNLKQKLEKYKFAKESVELLRHIVDAHGISVSSQKIEAIACAPLSFHTSSLHSFSGIRRYYHRFIK